MVDSSLPQKHLKGHRRALDARWLKHLTAGGDPGDGHQLATLVSFRTGVSEFNNGKFYEAHESFERAWLDTPYPERLFSLALAKLSAGFTHHEKGSLTTANKFIKDTQQWIAPLPATYAEIDITQLRNQLSVWLTSTEARSRAFLATVNK